MGGVVLFAAIAVASAACAGGPGRNPLEPVSACRNPEATAAPSFNASGGTVTVFAPAGEGCHWTAQVAGDAATWATVETPGPFNGPQVIALTLVPNPAFTDRTGTILLKDLFGGTTPVQTVRQRAATCLYAVSPSVLTLTASGTYDGAGDTPKRVVVTTEPADCEWTATSSVPSIRIVYDSASGTGGRSMYLSLIQWNQTDVPRTGEVTVAGRSGLNPDARVTVTQLGR